MKIYIVVDLFNPKETRVYTGKTQIAEDLKTHRNTITQYIGTDKIFKHYLILTSELIKQKKPGKNNINRGANIDNSSFYD